MLLSDKSLEPSLSLLFQVIVYSLVVLTSGSLLVENVDEEHEQFVRIAQECYDKQVNQTTLIYAIESFAACVTNVCDKKSGPDNQCGDMQRYTSICGRISSNTSSTYQTRSNVTYQSGKVCDWTIRVDRELNANIKISLQHIDIEYSPNCVNDYLAIYDSANRLNEIGRFCGNTFPVTLYSTGRFVRIIFQTDLSAVKSGFVLYYDAWSKDKYERIRSTEPGTAYRRISHDSGTFNIDDTFLVGRSEQIQHYEWLVRVEVGRKLWVSWTMESPMNNGTLLRIYENPSVYSYVLFSSTDTGGNYFGGNNSITNGTLFADHFQMFVHFEWALSHSQNLSFHFTYDSYLPSHCEKGLTASCPELNPEHPPKTFLIETVVVNENGYTFYATGAESMYRVIRFIMTEDLRLDNKVLGVRFTHFDFSVYSFDDCSTGGILFFDNDNVEGKDYLLGEHVICGSAEENIGILSSRLTMSNGSMSIIMYHVPLKGVVKNYTVGFILEPKGTENPDVSLHADDHSPQVARLRKRGLNYNITKKQDGSIEKISLFIDKATANVTGVQYVDLYDVGMNMKKGEDFLIDIASQEHGQRLMISTQAIEHKSCVNASLVLISDRIKMPTQMHAYAVTIQYKNDLCNYGKHFLHIRVAVSKDSADICRIEPITGIQRVQNYTFLPLRCGSLAFCKYSVSNPRYYEVNIGMSDDSQENEYYELYIRHRSDMIEGCEKHDVPGILDPLFDIYEFEIFKGEILLIASLRELQMLPFTWKTIGSYKTTVRLHDRIGGASARRDISISFGLYRYRSPLAEEEESIGECEPHWQLWRANCYNIFPRKRGAVTHEMWKPGFRNITWTNAVKVCKDVGGELTSVLNDDEANFLKYMIATRWKDDTTAKDKYIIYIGLSDKDTPKTYKWLDNTVMAYADWYNYGKDQHLLRGRFSTESSELCKSSVDEATFIDLEKLQPFSHSATRCSAMVFVNSHTTTNWVKVPCQFPFCKSSFICKKRPSLRAGGSSVRVKLGPAPPVPATSHEGYTYINPGLNSSNLIWAHFTCPSGWHMLYLPSAGRYKCYRLLNITHLIPNSVSQQPCGTDGTELVDSCRAFAIDFYDAAQSACGAISGVLAPMDSPDTSIMVGYLRLLRLEDGHGIWIDNSNIPPGEAVKMRGCRTFQYLPKILPWNKEQNILMKSWEVIDICDSFDEYKILFDRAMYRISHAFCSQEVGDPPVKPSCGNLTFACDDGTCLLRQYRCDGKPDCNGGEDESDCVPCDTYEGRGPDNYFRCSGGTRSAQCIPWAKYCDFIQDCDDGSDESSCSPPPCNISESKCDNGQCIDIVRWCDGVIDCLDGSDEVDGCQGLSTICGEHSFQCFTGVCLPKEQRFDDMVDCPGLIAEDEVVLPSTDTNVTDVIASCKEGEFKCSVGQRTCFNTEKLCLFDNNHLGKLDYCRNGGHLKNCDVFMCPPQTHFKCPHAYCVPFHRLCDGINDCPDAQDEHDDICTNYACPGLFKCKDERHCLTWDKVCDGTIDCRLSQADERFCELNDTCQQCDCIGTKIDCSGKSWVEIPNIARDVRALFLRGNRLQLTNQTFLRYTWLGALDISDNGISDIPINTFDTLVNLAELDLRDNLLTKIANYMFASMSSLRRLILYNNPITTIEANSFFHCTNLTALNLSGLQISEVSAGAFRIENASVVEPKLKSINLSLNNLEYIEKDMFDGLNELSELNMFLDHNRLSTVDKDVFSKLPRNTSLKTDDFKFCCIAEVNDCHPRTDPFSDCSDLMAQFALRLCIWVLGLIAIVGNCVVIVWRMKSEQDKVVSQLIQALGLSDMIMGVYLLIIAGADIYYRDNYAINSDFWRNSWVCKFAGFLAMLSNEMSVFMLLLITYERFIIVVYPFKLELRVNHKMAKILILSGFLSISLFSALPILGIPYFGTKDYIKNGVCLLYNFTAGRVKGWEYSAMIYLIMNLLAFISIFVGYIAIYRTVRITRQQAGKEFEDEAKFVRRITYVIASNFLCWMPIIFIGFVSVIIDTPLDPNVSAWMAVFIMPLNSAINPLLYTFSVFTRERKSQKAKPQLRGASKRPVSKKIQEARKIK